MWLGVVNCYSFLDNLWDRNIFCGYERKNTYYYLSYYIIIFALGRFIYLSYGVFSLIKN